MKILSKSKGEFQSRRKTNSLTRSQMGAGITCEMSSQRLDKVGQNTNGLYTDRRILGYCITYINRRTYMTIWVIYAILMTSSIIADTSMSVPVSLQESLPLALICFPASMREIKKSGRAVERCDWLISTSPRLLVTGVVSDSVKWSVDILDQRSDCTQ